MNEVSSPAPEVISLTTIPTAPDTPEGTPSTDAASAAAAKVTPDRGTEMAKRFNEATEKVSRVRRLEADLKAKEAEWNGKFQSVSQKEKALAEKERTLVLIEEELSGDPIAYLLKKGIDPVKIAERFAKPETEEQRETRKLRERLDAKDAEEQKTRERMAVQARKAEEERVMVQFVRGITPDECPNLTALYEAREVPELVEKTLARTMGHDAEGRPISLIQQFYGRHRRYPTDGEIREVLELEAGERATRLRSVRRVEAPRPPQGPPQRGPAGISNQHAGQRSSGRPAPKSFEERRAETRRRLTADLEAESAEARNNR